jgi:Uma2 family endonuclease
MILYEPELHLAEDILVPDLAGWHRERMPEVPSTAFVTLSPDWVCEVLSPSTQGIDRVRKSRIHPRERVQHNLVRRSDRAGP